VPQEKGKRIVLFFVYVAVPAEQWQLSWSRPGLQNKHKRAWTRKGGIWTWGTAIQHSCTKKLILWCLFGWWTRASRDL